jgi:cyclin H
VANVKGDRLKAMDIILSNELLLMQRLNYYLTVHNPYRPIEGFLIDIKTRCELANPERLRQGIDEFLDRTFLTDACLMYAPSQVSVLVNNNLLYLLLCFLYNFQIALAAVLHAASKEQENLDSYVTESLFKSSKDKLPVLIEAVRKIRSMVKTIDLPQKEAVKFLDKKLEKCRNQEFNPDSLVYKQRMKKMYEDDDDYVELSGEQQMNTSDSSAMNISSVYTID